MKKALLFLQHNKLWLKILCYVLIISIVLVAAYAGISIIAQKLLIALFPEGRGDWDVNLLGPYDIVKVNSANIVCGYRNDNMHSWKPVIKGFFVNGFQVHEPYIFLQGYAMKGIHIEDEEKQEHLLVYYVIDSTTEVVYGPLEESSLQVWIDKLENPIDFQWIYTNTKPVGAKP